MERYTRDLYHCSNCNYCVDAVWPQHGIEHVCVTMEQHTRAPGYSARGYIEAARAVAEGISIDAAQLAERVFTCTTCGNCETVCPIGLRPSAIARALRVELVDQGVIPAAVVALHQNVLSQGNPYGQPREARERWSSAPPLDRTTVTPGEQQVVYFAGCAAAVALPDEARAALRVLHRAGVTAALPAMDAHCCGAPLSELGYEADAGALAHGLQTRLDFASGQRLVVSGCECYAQLVAHTELAPITFASWLCDAYAGGTINLALVSSQTVSLRVRLLESCQLKPRPGTIAADDEQRIATLFKALGIKLLNDPFPQPHALCCGAAGGMPRMQPAAAARMASARMAGMREFENTCAPALAVTLDPRCAAHLRGANSGTRVLGVAEFVDAYLTLTPADRQSSDPR